MIQTNQASIGVTPKLVKTRKLLLRAIVATVCELRLNAAAADVRRYVPTPSPDFTVGLGAALLPRCAQYP
jgi:hypothetical protein